MPDVVLRPRSASCTLTLGPAFVSVTLGARPPRAFPRDAGAGSWGAVARIRVHLVEEPLTPALPQMSRLSLVDGQGTVLVTLPWDGDDHDSIEAACVAAGIALDRVPDEVPDGVGRTVELPAPTAAVRPREAGPTGVDGTDDLVSEEDGAAAVGTDGGSASGGGGRGARIRGWRGYRRGRRVTLVLGPREIAVAGIDGADGAPVDALRWPRLGCAGEYERVVARVRITLFSEQTVHDPDLLPGPPTAARQRVFGLTLLDVDGRPMAYLQWGTYDLPELRRAFALAGVLPEFRWQPYGDAATLAQRGVPVVRTAPGAVGVVGAGRVGARAADQPTGSGRSERPGRSQRRSEQSEPPERQEPPGRQRPPEQSERQERQQPPGWPGPPEPQGPPDRQAPAAAGTEGGSRRPAGAPGRGWSPAGASRHRVVRPGAMEFLRDQWLYGAAVLVLLLLTALVIALSH